MAELRAQGEAGAHADPVPLAFFDRSPLEVGPDLLGCTLLSSTGGMETGGRIVECEAYLGSHDPGSHASTKGVTARNRVMYGVPGSVYVYFTYGNHHMVNLVCESEGIAGAVLIRALAPTIGIDTMTARRNVRAVTELCNGPGKLTQALGIDLSDNGSLLGQGRLQVYAGRRLDPALVALSGRIGLSQGHELAYRFYVQGDPHVSRGRMGPAPASLRRAGKGRP